MLFQLHITEKVLIIKQLIMSKTLIIGILSGLALIGVIVSLILGMDTQVLVPILTALLGYLLRDNETAVMGVFKKIK